MLKVIKTIQFRNISEPWQRKMRESDAAIQFCAACDGMSSLEVWFSRVLAPSNVCGDEQSGRPLSSSQVSPSRRSWRDNLDGYSHDCP